MLEISKPTKGVFGIIDVKMMDEKDRSSECMALKLNHPNIIRYTSYGIIFRKGLFYHMFFMEKMDSSLAAYLTKNPE